MPQETRPLEIVWSPLALARLQEIRAFVALDKPDASERLATRIVSVVEALRIHSYLGRVGPEPGIRELIVGTLRIPSCIGSALAALYPHHPKDFHLNFEP